MGMLLDFSEAGETDRRAIVEDVRAFLGEQTSSELAGLLGELANAKLRIQEGKVVRPDEKEEIRTQFQDLVSGLRNHISRIIPRARVENRFALAEIAPRAVRDYGYFLIYYYLDSIDSTASPAKVGALPRDARSLVQRFMTAVDGGALPAFQEVIKRYREQGVEGGAADAFFQGLPEDSQKAVLDLETDHSRVVELGQQIPLEEYTEQNGQLISPVVIPQTDITKGKQAAKILRGVTEYLDKLAANKLTSAALEFLDNFHVESEGGQQVRVLFNDQELFALASDGSRTLSVMVRYDEGFGVYLYGEGTVVIEVPEGTFVIRPGRSDQQFKEPLFVVDFVGGSEDGAMLADGDRAVFRQGMVLNIYDMAQRHQMSLQPGITDITDEEKILELFIRNALKLDEETQTTVFKQYARFLELNKKKIEKFYRDDPAFLRLLNKLKSSGYNTDHYMSPFPAETLVGIPYLEYFHPERLQRAVERLAGDTRLRDNFEGVEHEVIAETGNRTASGAEPSDGSPGL